jgi:hypothetical protein
MIGGVLGLSYVVEGIPEKFLYCDYNEEDIGQQIQAIINSDLLQLKQKLELYFSEFPVFSIRIDHYSE